MKKVFLFLLFLMFLTSCEIEDPNTTWELKYVVFYPNFNDTVIITNHKGFYWSSDRGSNYIKDGPSITSLDIYHGSAPYKIIYYKKYKTP